MCKVIHDHVDKYLLPLIFMRKVMQKVCSPLDISMPYKVIMLRRVWCYEANVVVSGDSGYLPEDKQSRDEIK